MLQDRQDKSAVGFDYHHEAQKHSSQKDYANGFGGKFGVANDRQDKSAVGFEHVEKLSKHASQTGSSLFFKTLKNFLLIIFIIHKLGMEKIEKF